MFPYCMPADTACQEVQTMVLGSGSTSRTGWGMWQNNNTIGKVSTTIKFSFGKAGVSKAQVGVLGGLRAAVQLPATGPCSTPFGFCKPHSGSFCGVGLVTAGYNFCPSACVQHSWKGEMHPDSWYFFEFCRHVQMMMLGCDNPYCTHMHIHAWVNHDEHI